MINAVGIKFETDEKIYYADLNDNTIKKNITVLVETKKGLQFGKVATDALQINEGQVIGKILRISTKKDYQIYQNNKKNAASALLDARAIAVKYNLNMNIIDATFTFDRDQLLFHFYADERIDFRFLARDLASIYKTRIELRQIGVRDKAKKISGYGSCGQKLCCSRFLNDFDSVSISMAKNQNISLNPNKINGVCGRLLCCLKYENECYKQCRKCMPTIGQIVTIEQGEGRVVDVDLLNRKYKVDIKNIGVIEVNACNGSN